MTEQLQRGDIAVADSATTVGSHSNTGYPYNLTEEQITRIIFFFGARKANAKALKSGHSEVRDFTTMEKNFLKQVFSWFGFVVETPLDRTAAYRAVCARFRTILLFLKARPTYITPEIKKSLTEYGYGSILKNIVTVVDNQGRLRLRTATTDEKKKMIPFGQLEMILWEFQNVALDKLRMIVDSITPKDVARANLGMKSKALRDIYSVVHMARIGNRNPNMTLVNVNIGSAEPKEKITAYSNYVQKNRET